MVDGSLAQTVALKIYFFSFTPSKSLSQESSIWTLSIQTTFLLCRSQLIVFIMSTRDCYTPPKLPEEDIVTRALTYPYPRSWNESFIYSRGQVKSVPSTLDVNDPGTTPLLVVGSNGAPIQLRRKYGIEIPDIPVLLAHVHNMDIVFATGLARYGSISSTIIYSPGTVVTTHIILLDNNLVEQMNRTESSYYVCKLSSSTDARIELDVPELKGKNFAENREVLMYVAKEGPFVFNVDGKETYVRVKDFPARNKTLIEWSEKQALEYLKNLIKSPILSLEDWIVKVVQDCDYWEEILTKMLAYPKIELDTKCFEVVQTI